MGRLEHFYRERKGDIDCAVSVNIEVSCVLDDAPRNRLILCFGFIGKLRYYFANLNNAHATGVLKEIILLERRKVVVVTI